MLCVQYVRNASKLLRIASPTPTPAPRAADAQILEIGGEKDKSSSRGMPELYFLSGKIRE
jgi:hypothetical protein